VDEGTPLTCTAADATGHAALGTHRYTGCDVNPLEMVEQLAAVEQELQAIALDLGTVTALRQVRPPTMAATDASRLSWALNARWRHRGRHWRTAAVGMGG